MQLPAADDTIIAVSTGWSASPLGVVRLSGPDAAALVEAVGVTAPPVPSNESACWTRTTVHIDEGLRLPATVYWFRQPRSYTGQDVVELHTVGCLPVLRELCARLIRHGARRALPGEFTARAYLSGKLAADQVDEVLALMTADSQAAVRSARRSSWAGLEAELDALRERMNDLLARIEAGIDFVEEEDIRFVEPRQARAEIEELLASVAALRDEERAPRSGKPHVALAGLPNAGKSMLFNALIGQERAIVSPVLGTTRDVLAAQVDLGGVSAILQDCAGLGDSADELALASYVLAERAAEQADLVLWVHAAGTPWKQHEVQALARLPAQRIMVVISKTDLAPNCQPDAAPGLPTAAAAVSAVTGAGLAELIEAIGKRLSGARGSGDGLWSEEPLEPVSRTLERALAAAVGEGADLANPELVGFELRAACGALERMGDTWCVETVLERIFSQFCVGK